MTSDMSFKDITKLLTKIAAYNVPLHSMTKEMWEKCYPIKSTILALNGKMCYIPITHMFIIIQDTYLKDKLFPKLASNVKNWKQMSTNKWALPLSMHNVDKMEYCDSCLYDLCEHEWALSLLLKCSDKLDDVCISKLCKHKWALPLLINNINNFDSNNIHELCKHEWALSLLKKNADGLSSNCFHTLCNYEWALNLLMDYSDVLDLTCLDILCKHEWALRLITYHVDRLNIHHIRILCEHKWALPILIECVDHLHDDTCIGILCNSEWGRCLIESINFIQ